jgi:hypothetical protein
MSIAATYLVFGDLYGRVLPAFRLASAWAREHGTRLAGLLQVGDLGYFPDSSRLDKATKRHADDDPLELGVQQVTGCTKEADAVFAEPDVPEALWFTAGNHEDFDALAALEPGGRGPSTFCVDAYSRLLCIRDGHIAHLADGLRVGALWGIDDQAPNARRKTPPRGRIRERSAFSLAHSAFDVLLAHESPRDAMFADSGSDAISLIVAEAQPAFAFFGHYRGTGGQVAGDFGRTQVFHLSGLEFRGRGRCAEEGSVGVLRWSGRGGDFAYVDPEWLRTVTRDNWRHR